MDLLIGNIQSLEGKHAQRNRKETNKQTRKNTPSFNIIKGYTLVHLNRC